MAEIQDSGARREFASGAVRDIADGKGRCDLLPLDVVADLYCPIDERVSNMMDSLYLFITSGLTGHLENALREFTKCAGWHLYDMFIEVAIHFEDGCRKYGERNWEKGIPLHCFIDSAVRHLLKYLRGDEDERHDRAFVWNILCAMWTVKHHPELCDLPAWQKEAKHD